MNWEQYHYCPSCGNGLEGPKGETYCPSCGHNYSAAAPSPAPATAYSRLMTHDEVKAQLRNRGITPPSERADFLKK